MTLNDFKPRETVFSEFFAILAATHILSVNCNEIGYLKIDQDNLRIKFSASNADFSSPSTDPLGSRRPAHASVK